MALPRILIVGGGFGGLRVARMLKNSSAKITLVDRTNHHLFQPLLYQVASSALAPRDIAFPIREILKNQKNTRVIMDEVTEISLKDQKVFCSSGRELIYDYLVLAVGNKTSFFSHPEWAQHTKTLKSLKDSVDIRDSILTAYEEAEAADSFKKAENRLTFVVVGGGPTGVELAGAIGEIAHKTMLKNFRKIDPSDSQIFLIEGGERILPFYPPSLSAYAKKDLEKIGVNVLTSSRVEHIDAKGLTVSGKRIETKNIFWAAGNTAPSFLKSLDVPLDPQNRVVVTEDLSIPGYPEVFVIGDAAHCKNKKGAPLAGVAPVAIQQGNYVGALLKTGKKAEDSPPFQYKDKGSMATIGKARAVVMVRNLSFTGFFAWLMWSLIHIAFLIGWKHRFFVLLEWLFWYVTEARSSRLIHSPIKHSKRKPKS